MLLAILEAEFEPGKTILDLGYGSGIVEQMIFERIPHAQIVGVDRSEAMMALASERLKPYPFRFISVPFDLAELPSILGPASPLPRQQYQIVISVQALHHLTVEQMQAAYLTIYDILEPHGLFLLQDRIAVSTPTLWNTYQSLWRLLDVDEGETYEEHLAQVAARGDLPARLEQHLRWLSDAGFEAACLHLHNNRALIAARKL
jgi:cyclopropane fatty-acyl-phospholipid synthase-like methyltransferase